MQPSPSHVFSRYEPTIAYHAIIHTLNAKVVLACLEVRNR